MRLAETRDCRGKRLLHTAQSQTSPNLLTLQRGLSGHGLLMTNILLTPNNAYLSLPQPAPQSLPWPSPRLLCPIQATLHPWPCQQPGGTAAIVVGKGLSMDGTRCWEGSGLSGRRCGRLRPSAAQPCLGVQYLSSHSKLGCSKWKVVGIESLI